MENADYTIHGLRGAARELQDIAETEIKEAITGISSGTAEFALHFKGGAAPGFFKKMTALETAILEINRNLTGLAYDIEQTTDSRRRAADGKSDEVGNNA